MKDNFPDIQLFKPTIYFDNRGHFLEVYNRNKDYDLPEFVQSNISFSKANTLRGLHLQLGKFSQGKYIHVISGQIYDVVVDINIFSPYYGQWCANILGENEAIWVGRGYAHGFLALEDSLVLYNVTKEYNKENERTILWDDPDLNIDWPEKDISKLIISEKDKLGIRLKDL